MEKRDGVFFFVLKENEYMKGHIYIMHAASLRLRHRCEGTLHLPPRTAV